MIPRSLAGMAYARRTSILRKGSSMMPRDLADWDPIRDGSYLAALLDRAAEARDLKRMEAGNAPPLGSSPQVTWRARHANQPRVAATPGVRGRSSTQ
jgi:hypothetical protein